MEIFLAVSALIFLVFGSLLLLSPELIEKIAKVTNLVLVTVDDRIHAARRPLGILFLALSIWLWYIALWG